MKEYAGKVRVVYKHFVVHPDTVMSAHLAACAAGKQGKFIEFKHAFWEKGFGVYKQTRDPASMGEAALIKIAKELKLDTGKLTADMKGPDCQQRIQADMRELSKFGVNGTPTFFVNGKHTMFSGDAPFKALVDAEIAAVEASGVPADQYYQKVVFEKGEKQFRSKKDAGHGH